MLAIRTELEAIAQALDMIYLRALNVNDLNQLLQNTTIDKPLLVLANVPEFTDEPITSNLNWGIARTTILVLGKNTTPDPKPAEIDTLLDDLLEKVKYIQDALDRSLIKASFEDNEYISLNSTDQIELTDEVISGWELVTDIPMVREIYYCPTPPPPDYSPEAQAVFDLMPNEPSTALKDIIAKFVDNENSKGNWAKYDNFAVYCTGMESEANALQSWITANPFPHTNNGAVIGVNGAQLAGAQHIDSNYNPNSQGVNFQLNSAQIEHYLVSAIQDNAFSVGSRINQDYLTIQLRTANDIRTYVNSPDRITSGTTGYDNSLIGAIRTGSNADNILLNGNIIGSGANASSIIPNFSLFVGSQNLGGTPAPARLTGTISTFMAGGVLPDQTAHYDNVRQLLIDLGAIPALLSL